MSVTYSEFPLKREVKLFETYMETLPKQGVTSINRSVFESLKKEEGFRYIS